MRVRQRHQVVLRHGVRQPHPQVIELDAPVLVVRLVQAILVLFAEARNFSSEGL